MFFSLLQRLTDAGKWTEMKYIGNSGGGGGRAIPSQLSNVTSDGFGFASPLSV